MKHSSKDNSGLATLMALGVGFAAAVVGGALSAIAIKSHPMKKDPEPKAPPAP